MNFLRPFSFLASAALCIFANSAHADLAFSVNFSAQAQNDLSAAEQLLFTDAVNFWDDVIIGHRDLVNRNWTLNVNTFMQAASGGSVQLGNAGPSGLAFSDVVAGSHTSNQRFIISTGGIANFNVHPDAGALSADTIKHEIGHALGIGTLWEDNEVYNDGTGGNSNRTLVGGTPGQYVGPNALAAWQAEFVGQSGATFIPVELGGSVGTTHGHWNEVDGGGSNTGIVDFSGNDMRDELMTGWASPNPDFFSNMSRQSLVDIGFNVTVAVPEPGNLTLLTVGSASMLGRRRKQL